MEDLLHVDQPFHEFRLIDITRDAVEHQSVNVRFEFRLQYLRLNLCSPKFDREIVRNEQPLAGVLDELLAERRSEIQGTKHFATGAMKKSWNTSEHLALRSFSAAWSAHDKISHITGHKLEEDQRDKKG